MTFFSMLVGAIVLIATSAVNAQQTRPNFPIAKSCAFITVGTPSVVVNPGDPGYNDLWHQHARKAYESGDPEVVARQRGWEKICPDPSSGSAGKPTS